MRYLMVLPDGRTFDTVGGCSIIGIPGEWDIDDTVTALRCDPWPDEAFVVGAFDERDGVLTFETSDGEVVL